MKGARGFTLIESLVVIAVNPWASSRVRDSCGDDGLTEVLQLRKRLENVQCFVQGVRTS